MKCQNIHRATLINLTLISASISICSKMGRRKWERMPDNLEKSIEHEAKFHDLTEEEYDVLDEKWTKNPPKPGPNGTGFFAQRKAAAQSARSITVDTFTADYLLTKAIAAHKTPADIIGEMAQDQIAAAL
jgi:hypothetical protein